MPLKPATNPAVAATKAIQRPCPQSGSLSDSGSIVNQTKTESPTRIPPVAETMFGALPLFPIIERVCIIVAANRTTLLKISMMVATYPAL